MDTVYFTAIVLVAYLSPVFTQCPTGSNFPTTVNGTASPSTPSVTIGQTCYTVNFFGTQMLECRDSKGASALKSARWLKAPSYTQIVQSTASFINGDVANANLTVSNAQTSYAGDYICQLCYESNYTQCTNSSAITLIVYGTALTSVTASVSSTTPVRGNQVTFTCSVEPTGAATSYRWFFGTNQVSSSATYTISAIGSSQSGVYKCEAGNSYNTLDSITEIIDVQYVPEASFTNVTIIGDLSTADIVITCNMNANPAVLLYTFFDNVGSLLQNSSSNTFAVTSSSGYQIYSCRARNSVGLSTSQYHDVQLDTTSPAYAIVTENTGTDTGTIVVIVLGIIFLLLLIIIIVVCCLSYGWCHKKEKIEPEIIAKKPVVKPYFLSVSASSVERRYITPQFHLKPATGFSAGPIISKFDDHQQPRAYQLPALDYSPMFGDHQQPRAHQLPALDTQYLYKNNVPRKHKKKRRRRHHDDVSTQRQFYESEPDVGYDVKQPASDEDLVVIPGRKNYLE